jgi:beta-glucosidase
MVCHINTDVLFICQIKAVADVNERTVVVIHSVGPVDMTWAEHPNISAIVWAGLPGQESGNSLADVLFGDVNPSGRLPYTIAKSVSDYPVRIDKSKEIRYTEDLNIGYRYFENKVLSRRNQEECGWFFVLTAFYV